MVPYAVLCRGWVGGRKPTGARRGPRRQGRGRERAGCPPGHPAGKGVLRDSPPISSSSVSIARGCPWDSWILLRGQAAACINPYHPPSRPASPCHGHNTIAGVDSRPHFSWGRGQMAPGSLARGGCRTPGQKGLAMWPPSLLGPQLSQGAPSLLPAPSAKGGCPKWTGPQAAPPLPAEPSLVQGFTLLPALLERTCASGQDPPGCGGGVVS